MEYARGLIVIDIEIVNKLDNVAGKHLPTDSAHWSVTGPRLPAPQCTIDAFFHCGSERQVLWGRQIMDSQPVDP